MTAHGPIALLLRSAWTQQLNNAQSNYTVRFYTQKSMHRQSDAGHDSKTSKEPKKFMEKTQVNSSGPTITNQLHDQRWPNGVLSS
jgi:hypothetical protein